MDEPFWDSKIYWKNLALPVALCCYWANRRVLVKSNPNHHILIWTWQVKNRSLQISSQAIWLNHTLCAVLQKPDRLIQYISTTSQQQEASLIVLKHSLGWNQKDLCQRIDSDADYGGIRARMKTSLFGGVLRPCLPGLYNRSAIPDNRIYKKKACRSGLLEQGLNPNDHCQGIVPLTVMLIMEAFALG